MNKAGTALYMSENREKIYLVLQRNHIILRLRLAKEETLSNPVLFILSLVFPEWTVVLKFGYVRTLKLFLPHC